MAPRIWQGSGAVTDTSSQGGSNLSGGTILRWDYQGAAKGKVEILAAGTFVLRDLTMKAGGTVSGTSEPALLVSTNANIFADSTVTWIGQGTKSFTQASCTIYTDAIVIGGDRSISQFGNADDSDNQGYASRILGGNFYNIRHAVKLQNDANSIMVDNLTIWSGCSSAANDAAILVGVSGSSAPTSNNYIGKVLIEAGGWPYAVALQGGSASTMVGPVFSYDEQTTTLGVVRIDSGVTGTAIVEGLTPATKVLYGGVGTPATVWARSDSTGYGKIASFTAGAAGYPVKLFYVTMNGGGGATIVQPSDTLGAQGAGKEFIVKQQASVGGAEVFSVQNDGQVNLGNLSQAGNITNGLNGCGLSANMKTWGCVGQSGGNMIIDSGTGGSHVTLKAFDFIFDTQGGTQFAFLGQSTGGSSKPGIQFGSSGDVKWWREDSNTMRSDNSVLVGNHLRTAGTSPALTSCGTSPSISGSDTAGRITIGTSATGCVATFNATYTTAPFCTVTNEGGVVFTYAISATALTLTNGGDLSSTKVDYHCTGV